MNYCKSRENRGTVGRFFEGGFVAGFDEDAPGAGVGASSIPCTGVNAIELNPEVKLVPVLIPRNFLLVPNF